MISEKANYLQVEPPHSLHIGLELEAADMHLYYAPDDKRAMLSFRPDYILYTLARKVPRYLLTLCTLMKKCAIHM